MNKIIDRSRLIESAFLLSFDIRILTRMMHGFGH